MGVSRPQVSLHLREQVSPSVHGMPHSSQSPPCRDTRDNSIFVRFINMLINDTTFLLDESLDTLKAIHETQEALRDESTWQAQPQVLALLCMSPLLHGSPPPLFSFSLTFTASPSSQLQEAQQSQLEQLVRDERQCHSYLTLTSEILATFHYLTKEIRQPFLRPVSEPVVVSECVSV